MTKGKSLVSFFIIPLLIGLTILIGVSASLYYLGIQSPLEKQAKQLLASRTAERANVIEERVEQIKNAIYIAGQSVLGEPDSEVTSKLKKQVPQLDKVVLFDSSEIKPSEDSDPVITHVVIDLLKKAEEGDTPSPELILKGGQPSYIAFTEKLADDRLALATISLNTIKAVLGKADGNSRLELRQHFGDITHTVSYVGATQSSGEPLIESEKFGANWSIALWQEVSVFSTDAGQLPLLLFVAAILAFLIVGLLPLLSMKRLFSSDARKFIAGVKENAVSSKKYQLKFFRELSAGYARVTNESISKADHSEDLEAETDNKRRKARPLINPDESDAESSGEQSAEDDTPEPSSENVSAVTEDASSTSANNLSMSDSLDMSDTLDVNEDSVSQNIIPEIFREYDIRGVVGKSLDAETVYVIGKAIGSEAYSRGEQSIVIGRDGRLSSPELHKALKDGLLASGRDVIDIGMVPTPLVYFATHTLDSRSGVMLTGSHNPPEHNGLKIVLSGETLHGKDIKEILKRIQMQEFFNGKGQYHKVDIEQDYLAKVSSDISIENPLKVAIDCGNGVTGQLAPKVFQALGCEVIGLYTDIDGNFPNHHPDPNQSSNLEDLSKMVVSEQADIGIAFDGDGDRVGVVDNSGKVIWTDRLMMLFAQDVLQRNPGSEVIYDVKCTHYLKEVINEAGGKPIMWKTGHSLMKAKMRETGAPLGGEGSGHVYFNERWYGFDDAIYAAARLLELVGKSPSNSSEMFAALPEGFESEEINVPIPDKVKFKLIQALMAKGNFSDGEVTTIDGLRVDYGQRWFLARASNTSASIVVKFEAENEVALESVKENLKKELLKIAPKLKVNF